MPVMEGLDGEPLADFDGYHYHRADPALSTRKPVPARATHELTANNQRQAQNAESFESISCGLIVGLVLALDAPVVGIIAGA